VQCRRPPLPQFSPRSHLVFCVYGCGSAFVVASLRSCLHRPCCFFLFVVDSFFLLFWRSSADHSIVLSHSSPSPSLSVCAEFRNFSLHTTAAETLHGGVHRADFSEFICLFTGAAASSRYQCDSLSLSSQCCSLGVVRQGRKETRAFCHHSTVKKKNKKQTGSLATDTSTPPSSSAGSCLHTPMRRLQTLPSLRRSRHYSSPRGRALHPRHPPRLLLLLLLPSLP
jgi:hypothetical protein